MQETGMPRQAGSRLSLAAKLRWAVVLAMLAFFGVVAALAWRSYVSLMDEKLRLTRNMVEQAVRIADGYYQQQQAGRLSTAQAQARAGAEIKALRYDGREYVWVNDMHPRVVFHPIRPELEGRDVSDMKDPRGKRLFVDFVDVVKRDGSGYSDYEWPHPGKSTPELKRSYVRGFAPWGWVLGSGVYVGQVQAVARDDTTFAFGVVALLALWCIASIELISRRFKRRLDGAADAMAAVAAGDLSRPIDAGADDEVGRLLRNVGVMQRGLAGMVRQIREATENISRASADIAEGSEDLSDRTRQTSGSLQQAAASVEQLTGTVEQSAASARQADELASSAADVAAHGGEVVSAVVVTMDQINAASKRISEIIGVIDGIAFQTNILALNAAVEAARAGEQGRGFAVVAGEVRGLAQRSAEAAREIKALIGTSVVRVDSGTQLVGQAGQTMQQIVGSVQRVSRIIGEISVAASEQSEGIGQVNASVMQLEQMTRQNAALVQEGAGAASCLRAQTAQLAKAVGMFKLEA
jgi:methyl-accepting chemotaxis protein